MLDQINDSPEHAKILAKLLRGIRSKINLIPFNTSDQSPFISSPEERILEFQNILIEQGYSVFIRASKGADISAACGQLRGQKCGHI
jgi:23S rRNA (adenine2503-C2)-methyltransferase